LGTVGTKAAFNLEAAIRVAKRLKIGRASVYRVLSA
jgi:hypothetical protein